MLLVKTSIGLSNLHGIGLFAAENIIKGKKVWVFQDGFDLQIDKDFLSKMSIPVQEQILKYAYFNGYKQKYILCSDDARFINHSSDPNLEDLDFNEEEGYTIAKRDIQAGEELTSNYEAFDHAFQAYAP